MPSQNHLIILIHGINTRAFWMEEIKPSLENAGFSVAPTSYGKFGVLRFLSFFSKRREEAIKRIVREIRLARRAYMSETGHEPDRMSVISHSFGTYVIGRILMDYPEFKFYRLIFCGSVVKDNFPFDENDALERFSHPLLNEAGTKDYWPALAESIGWDYGSVGSTGFISPPVETRWHKGFAHSDFLKQEFSDKFWVPFLLGQTLQPADRGQEMPLWIRTIAALPLRYLFLPQMAWLMPLLAITLGVTYGELSSSQRDLFTCAIEHPTDVLAPKPRSLGTSIEAGTATVKGVKIVLKALNFYKGDINSKPTIEYLDAVSDFQQFVHITPDHYVGPQFLDALQSRVAPELLQKISACGR